MRKGRFAAIFSVVILGACMVWFVASGIIALTKSGSVPPERAQRGDLCEFAAVYFNEAFEVKNSVNFIPTGKEHYYLMVSEDGIVRYLVRAKPSWIDKHFTEIGLAESDDVKVKGVVTRMDYELTKEVREMNSELMANGTLTAAEAFDTNFYIDARYKEFGRLRIFSGVGIVVVGVLFYFGMMSGLIRSNKLIGAVFGIVLLGAAMLLIYTISVGGM